MYSKSSLLLISLLFFAFSCKIKKQTATSLSVENKELQSLAIQKDLKTEIKTWIGTPYKYGGNSKQGIDCSGLVNIIYKKVYNIKLPRTSKSIYTICRPIELKNIKEGDLVFFDYAGKGISHVGIYLNNGEYIHASSSKGVVISKLHTEYTMKKFKGAGRIQKL